jgi:curved DNA-binding protein CbpA
MQVSAEAKFIAINNAYQVLSDRKSRAEYDSERISVSICMQ